MRSTREAVKDQILDRQSKPLLTMDKDVKRFSDMMCHNDCHDHGACIEAKCVCSEGWTGVTCNVVVADDVPVMLSGENQMCDTSERNCNQVVISGYNFKNNMKCYATPFKVCEGLMIYLLHILTIYVIYRGC